MKTLIMICIVAAFLSGCEEETVYNEPKIYNYRIYISGGRITKFDYINGDTVSSRTEYLFEDSIVTKTSIRLPDNLISKTIFKIGQNGFASSSIEIPERYDINANLDTVYTSRLLYDYDAENHLIGKTFEIIREGENLGGGCYEYGYINGNLISEDFVDLCVIMPHPSSSHCGNTFVPSKIPSKLDIHDFTNGILGVTSRCLIKHAEYLDGCCSPGLHPRSIDYIYELDKQGYVIQKKELSRTCIHAEWSNSISTKISNYEIHFND